MLAAVLGLVVAGFLRIERQPYRWTLFIAIVFSLLLLLFGGVWLILTLMKSQAQTAILLVDIALLGPTTLGLWDAVARAAKVRPLLKEHPDLFVVRAPAKRKRGERAEAGPGEIRGKLLKMARENRARTRRIMFYASFPILAAIIGLVLLNTFYAADEEEVAPSTELPSFWYTVSKFKTSWNKGDEAAILAMVQEGRRATFRRVMDAKKKKYGWDGGLPPLGAKLDERYLYGEVPQLAIFYRISDPSPVERVRIRMKHVEGQWWLSGVTFLES